MFGRGITLFKLLGFAVRVDASWLLIAGLVTWSLTIGYFPAAHPGLAPATYLWMGIAGALLLFASIVVHEFAHSLVARRYRIPMKSITLFVFGGVADMEQEPKTPKAEFLMALAGPVASILLGAILYLIHASVQAAWPVPAAGVVAYLAWINWVIAAFNLIPAFPLDGGRMLRAGLWHWKGDLVRATRTASSVGSGFAILLMVLGMFQLFAGNFVTAVWWFLIGAFLRMIATASYASILMNKALSGEPIRRFMDEHPDVVPPGASVQELVDEHVYRHHHRMIPVVQNQNHLVGCVTTDEIRGVPRDQWSTQPVEHIAKPCSPENAVTPDTDAAEALRLMEKRKRTQLMVVDGDRLLGIVSASDLMEFLSMKLELEGERLGQPG